jgi:hypothetical protein
MQRGDRGRIRELRRQLIRKGDSLASRTSARGLVARCPGKLDGFHMAVASFKDLCAGFCEIVGSAPPALQADIEGLVAFHVTLRGATVNLVHYPEKSPGHFFVLFEYGPVGQDGADASEQLEALLDANFVLDVHPPVFSRNPATGEVVLQHVCPLFEATPSGLYELINTGVDRVSQWRQPHQSMHEAGADSSPEWQRPAQVLHNFA